MRKHKPHFRTEPLRDMVAVGAVGPHAVRLWMRSGRPGTLRIRWWSEDQGEQGAESAEVRIPEQNDGDNTLSISLPDDVAPPARLDPMRRYRFRVVHGADGHVVGEGRFETAPEQPEAMPRRFSIALMSCHQPFNRHGKPFRSALDMLRATRRCLQQHNTKLVLTMGDQIYADYPSALSLFNERYFSQVAPQGRTRLQACTPEEVCRLYQARYRSFWGLPDWQALHAEYPCYPILDDHEIIDNWGSDPAHQTKAWEAVATGARAAYLHYQGSRVLPPTAALPASFHYAVQYGDIALFVMDLRSERRASDQGQLFSDAQEADLRQFLHDHRTKQMLFIVLSVPVIHLPRYVAQVAARVTPSGEDFSDRWSSGAHLRDRDRFLELLHAHQRQYPSQRLLLLSGDIHIGCAHEIQWDDSDLRFYQMISSGITHVTGRLVRLAARLSIRFNRRIATYDNRLSGTVRFLPGVDNLTRNPYGKLNLGIIEVTTPVDGTAPKARLLLYGHRGDEPVCVYRSPEI
jgi:alkaline phosphatase D